ncbi:ribbon-helix-helix protein, CopG family [Methylomonas sp. UP202]|uniref:ribbon-helix-helix protein, CopG family n=1 Tax=Methylomonas sp. UP202 TaxID=3040943 RepID=UPI00247AE432|nr:ribbon-helix-helix protein, CopG family [Methylomonas sp. UP202]WGS87349.1 ribbon-helix-helix protein, CopG family [Methylomonas sp. UP202]
MKKKISTRVQLELPEKSMERLLVLKEKTEATSYAEVVKNALRLYENMIEQYESGKQIFLKDDKGNIMEYQIFY